MKKISLMIFVLFSLQGYAQKKTIAYQIQMGSLLKENVIYIFGRGTRTKSALIAEKFNIADTNITHIGIGFLENNQLRLYNVCDNNNGSALKIDSLESFLFSADVYYIEIWQLTTSFESFKIIVNACKNYSAKQLYFDNSFTIADDDSLYCSEFCAKVLQSANLPELNFMPKHYILDNSLYEAILGRKLLVYFPVDFFQKSKFFSKIFEYRFEEDF